MVFENTHEPIIDQATFDNVQRLRSRVKRRPDGWGYIHPLTGLVYCSDCGSKLYAHRIYNGKDMPTYVCGNASKPAGAIWKCTGHRIEATKLMTIIAETLKEIAKTAQEDEDAFAKKVNDALSARQTSEIKSQKKQLAKLRKRTAEIETLFKKIYEDNALGKLPDNRFNVLAAEYENEQEQLDREIPVLQSIIDAFNDGNERASRFIELVKRYRDFDEITVSMLNEFVEKIIVHERDIKYRPDSEQRIEIHLNFIGEFCPVEPEPISALTPAQEEEQRKLEERRERMRQNYLTRKANGKQKEYDERYKEKVRARYANARAALREEGAVIGANIYAPFVVASN